jgi:hypothetical protein
MLGLIQTATRGAPLSVDCKCTYAGVGTMMTQDTQLPASELHKDSSRCCCGSYLVCKRDTKAGTHEKQDCFESRLLPLKYTASFYPSFKASAYGIMCPCSCRLSFVTPCLAALGA